MRRGGFEPEDYESDPVEIWPENQQAFALFDQFRTQWIQGAVGPTGLNYGPILHQMDRMKLDEEAFDQLFAELRVIEIAALCTINKPSS